MVLWWSSKVETSKQIIASTLEATFLLTDFDIQLAMRANRIFIDGAYYKVPKKQLENALHGRVKLKMNPL